MKSSGVQREKLACVVDETAFMSSSPFLLLPSSLDLTSTWRELG
jgi:hypothetical protein